MESFNKTSDTSTIKTSKLALYCLRFALSLNKISGTSTIKTSKLVLYCLRFALSLPWRIKSAYNNNIQLMAHLPDDIILNGFISFNGDMTKEYFYGYCRRAYSIYDRKYQLHGKAGLDFYSLAHDYYIQLLTHHFEPLLKKPKAAKLSTWMVRGFHFVVLDALKAYNKEYEHLSEEASDVVLEYVRSTDKEEGMLLQVAEAVASHYHDRMMQEIAHMVFYAGFKQKDVAAQLGITPAAVNMRYKKMMEEVVTPYVIENYGEGLTMAPVMEPCMEDSSADACFSKASPMSAASLSRFANWQQESEQNTDIMNRRITPSLITALKPNEIFVFGSNLQGIHAGGAARAARLHFGAVMGQGVGMQGQSYAIPTMQGGTETIKPYVDEFVEYARKHPELHFLVTAIGCGIAGFDADDIAPLFEEAKDIENISLPDEFWDVLE